MELTQGFQCLGHSKWTICSLLSKFCPENFPTLNFYTGECQFLITPEAENEKKGIHPNKDETQGSHFSVPGTYKLDKLQTVKQILFGNFSNFCFSYWGRPFPIFPGK